MPETVKTSENQLAIDFYRAVQNHIKNGHTNGVDVIVAIGMAITCFFDTPEIDYDTKLKCATSWRGIIDKGLKGAKN